MGKRYGYIYEKAFNRKAAGAAIDEMVRRKRSKPLRAYLAKHREELIDEVLANPHHDGRAHCFTVNECGKPRPITDPCIHDQIIGRMIRNAMSPYVRKVLDPHTYASVKGRGPLKAMRDVYRVVREKKPRWFTKDDVVKCFPRFVHAFALKAYDWKFKDPKLRATLVEWLNAIEGLTLGDPRSQEFCNFCFTLVIAYCRHVLKVLDIFVYMDDFLLVARSKREATRCRDGLEAYLKNEGFDAHVERSHAKPLEYEDRHGKLKGEAIDFCGYRIYRNAVALRKSLWKRVRRSIIRVKRDPTPKRLRRFFSYWGYIKHSSHYLIAKKYGLTPAFIEGLKGKTKGAQA